MQIGLSRLYDFLPEGALNACRFAAMVAPLEKKWNRVRTLASDRPSRTRSEADELEAQTDMKALSGLIAGAALCGFASHAIAQESTNRVAVESMWSVFVEDDPRECWIVSSPTQMVNTRDGQVVSVRRGDVRLFVAFRPESGGTGEVSFTGGYPFADGSTVELEVDGTEFELFTGGEWAWPASSAQDADIIAALKAGADAKLTGRSSRGTQTDDTFSLIGFSAAHDEAQSRCQ